MIVIDFHLLGRMSSADGAKFACKRLMLADTQEGLRLMNLATAVITSATFYMSRVYLVFTKSFFSPALAAICPHRMA
jgi:hypothetical protein